MNRFGTTVKVWKDITNLLVNLSNDAIAPCKIYPTVEDPGVALIFRIDNVEIQVEYYNDGEIAFYSEDSTSKDTIECLDLTEDRVLKKIMGYYKIRKC